MQSDVATISVITSGLVAIATILLPLFFNFISDWLKWRRERRLSEVDKIERVTTDLMSTLSEIWAHNYEPSSSGVYPGRPNWSQIHGRLLNSFYIWERTLLPYSDKRTSDRIMGIHSELETRPSFATGKEEDKVRQARLSREIHEITYKLAKNVK